MKKIAITLSVAAVAAFAAGASAQTYSIGTNPQGSLFYASGAAIAKLMVEKTGLQFRVQPYAGSSTYLPLINAGKLAFGMANGAEAYYAHSGAEIFRQPSPNLRQVGNTFDTSSGFAVPMDSPVKTLADLKGKKLPIEYTSGRIFHFLSNALLNTEGMTNKDVRGIPTPNFITGAKLLMAGRVDAAYFPLNTAIAKQANATIKGGIRYVKMGCSEQTKAKIKQIVPAATVGMARPGKNATAVVENPTCFINVMFTVVSGTHVPADVVYKLVMTMYKNKPALAKSLGAFNRWKTKEMAAEHPNPYHPGAIKAYKELGIWHGK